MTAERRHAVHLSEAEIDALIVTVGQCRLIDVHICRIKQTHSGLQELKEVRDALRSDRGQ